VKKVVHISPLYFEEGSHLGGGERYPANLARGIVGAARGTVSIEILSFGSQEAEVALAGGVVLRVLKGCRSRASNLDAFSWDLPAHIERADLVHVHQPYTATGQVASLLAKRHGIPLVATDLGGISNRIGHRLASLDLADRVVSISEFGASILMTATESAVVRGGVDAEFFTPDDAGAREHVLYAGRLLPHKGIDRLIEAMPAEVPLLVCGRPYDERFFARLQKLARGKRVSFVLDADDEALRALYRRAWVTVLPSVYGPHHEAPELMGLTLLESMACGTPAICSRVGGMPEYVDEGRTGYVLDDLSGLAPLVRTLAGDRELVDRLGRQGRRAVEERFDLRVTGRHLLDVYAPFLGMEAPSRS
jgi:glycosyltransferase involved in cell wall biosynthesis